MRYDRVKCLPHKKGEQRFKEQDFTNHVVEMLVALFSVMRFSGISKGLISQIFVLPFVSQRFDPLLYLMMMHSDVLSLGPLSKTAI